MLERADRPGLLTSGARLRGFQDLMRHRVREVILVSSLYDSFILAQDGQINELVLSEFLNFDLRRVPDLTHVMTGPEAVDLARRNPESLIISSTFVGDLSALDLGRAVKTAGLSTPVTALAYDSRDLTYFSGQVDLSPLDRVFLWQGDVRILPAIVNDLEDRLNVAHDTGERGVQAIIVVEDSVPFYSSLLPSIYWELMQQSHRLIPEGMNRSHKLMRLQARPKVLLCRTYEDAWAYFSQYRESILGVISDIEFPKGGTLCAEAGVELARRVRELQPDVPVMLQSSVAENESLAHAVGADFLLKESPTLLHQLGDFMLRNFGFGDFIFRLSDGTEVARATDLKTLEHLLRTVPADSIAYHASRNHFSNWLKARTEFALAHSLRPRKVEDFATVDDLRWNLVEAIQEYRRDRNSIMVADFDRQTFDAGGVFYRIGGGSLGGKARGLAFVNLLLHDHGIGSQFPGIEVVVPRSVVLGTEVFDRFLEDNGLRDLAIGCDDDATVVRAFQRARFPQEIRRDLAAYLEVVGYPIAVRSSSLLEDSHYQPFAGVYATYMLANDDPDPGRRLEALLAAIKRVYASTFSSHAKAYLRTTPYRLEEEKMAVILQKLIGSDHHGRFYPEFAGVARSHNFYPTPPMTSGDGIAAVALGFGETVVNGEPCLRFCPRYPQHVVQFSSTREIVRNSQRHFYALRLARQAAPPEETRLTRCGLELAEEDGTLGLVGSTYSQENDAVYDGISRPGARVVTFASILKHRYFPLAEILQRLLDIGQQATGTAVELEFAVDLSQTEGRPRRFAFLQLRPLALSREFAELELGEIDPQALVCYSASVMGNGKLDHIRDLVVVDFHQFDRGRSREAARDVARFNAQLVAAGTPYVLIGVGRWGSSEPYLGIPVTWDQIAGARVIVEAGLRDFKVSPSQGTHFFQNLTSANVGYFTVNPEAGEGFVDWAWLGRQPAAGETAYVKHVRLDRPLIVKMNGRTNQGVIEKPGEL